MSIRILIAEDEAILAATLSAALQRLWPEAEFVATCANGVQAVEQALALRPDVLFLDIKMPGKTGLEAAEEITEAWDGKPPLVVFVTAYDQYAVDAFDQQAADYVLKPISDARLARTVERLQARLATPAPETEMAQLLQQLRALAPAAPPAPRLQMIRAAVGNQVRMIPVADVIYFEAMDKYVNVVTADSESLIRTSLRELLPQLDADLFWQVHRGTVVNSSCILAAMREENGKLSLQLRGRSERPRVSPLYAHLFRQM
ncbi:LytTR family DNA-binding domain-containing protein [Massilia sp. TS11]|uniref:LytR/AlgR family response regulator transcription factor n=1 Tax=Massilia sp. TS11 TaxID=2908003 RepID=UPI001EDA2DDA|nr:LytTR family DNA-binding domain-containing protein [Massilia sp. TS11]MCG2585697.1 LytTR family DNA-binding domain-containing protein [Massilia sp. TS11]